ncbi:hypothetical protein BC938DRAFT_481897 [Jimgerdemannia flammicorona]|uniref:Uncharacterized protein n=1 Tax=Jimgerdemannia flammicorona TaxID=994334 RepID=A0A433QF55_9FUNG|nr:hypothetical protein BC938DRAFT_481897 [Jimgerdemannia flammicorona]
MIPTTNPSQSQLTRSCSLANSRKQSRKKSMFLSASKLKTLCSGKF